MKLNRINGHKIQVIVILRVKFLFLAAILDFANLRKMLKVTRVASFRFGISTLELTRNHQKTLYISQNKVRPIFNGA